ncbi:MAG: transporter [Methylococcaceae bacterium]|jgi:hypothetical protein
MTLCSFIKQSLRYSVFLLLFSTFSHADISISNPGPDLANYPNSAFTLPEGRAYIEAAPLTYNAPTATSTQQFNLGYLLRYGFTDDIELRLLSNGFTLQDNAKITGMSPQVFDVKWHVRDLHNNSYLPAVGIEMSVQSDWASTAFKSGTQPALSINFDQILPYDIAIEYNVGFLTTQNADANTVYQLALSWAAQRNISDDLAVFVNGYSNTAPDITSSAIGGGMQWTITHRIAVFTNITTGLSSSTPSLFSLLGFAVAL